MTHGPTEHTEKQQFLYHRIQFEDGTTHDIEQVWLTDQQLSKMPATQQESIKHTRAIAQWLAMQNLFEGNHPYFPKATRVIATWTGTKGAQPTPADYIS